MEECAIKFIKIKDFCISNRKEFYISLLIISAIVLLCCISILIVQRNFIFDDSFITYRYSQNFVEGYGLRWNKYDSPTEGYTSLLHVLTLTPFIYLGLKPLFMTKVFSLISVVGTSILIADLTNKHYSENKFITFFVILSYLAFEKTYYLSTVGLETVVYTFFIFLSFYYLTLFIDSPNKNKHLILFGTSQFIAFLWRPEALILAVSWIYFVLHKVITNNYENEYKISDISKILLLTLVLPLSIYFALKHNYFGSFLPNPFFIKALNNSFFSQKGIMSIISYYLSVKLYLLFACISFIFIYKPNIEKHRLLCMIFIIAYSAFYVKVDTLMDIYTRFLYPITPFLFYLAIPTIGVLFEQLIKLNKKSTIKIPLIFMVFTLLFINTSTIPTIWAGIHMTDYHDNNELMQREAIMAKNLSKYNNIQNISIAFGDAGTISYYTKAAIIDTVGLNDGYIAREKNCSKIVNYLFSKKPTLIFSCTEKDLSLITYGHGPLGNGNSWRSDNRWNDYTYVGTVKTNLYFIHMYLRKDYDQHDELLAFIQKNVVDEILPGNNPLRLGT